MDATKQLRKFLKMVEELTPTEARVRQPRIVILPVADKQSAKALQKTLQSDFSGKSHKVKFITEQSAGAPAEEVLE